MDRIRRLLHTIGDRRLSATPAKRAFDEACANFGLTGVAGAWEIDCDEVVWILKAVRPARNPVYSVDIYCRVPETVVDTDAKSLRMNSPIQVSAHTMSLMRDYLENVVVDEADTNKLWYETFYHAMEADGEDIDYTDRLTAADEMVGTIIRFCRDHSTLEDIRNAKDSDLWRPVFMNREFLKFLETSIDN